MINRYVSVVTAYLIQHIFIYPVIRGEVFVDIENDRPFEVGERIDYINNGEIRFSVVFDKTGVWVFAVKDDLVISENF